MPTPPKRCDTDLITPETIHLVESIARGIAPHLPIALRNPDDLRGAGMLGLVAAAVSYDPALGVPFGAWARMKIRGAILDSVRKGRYRRAMLTEQLDPLQVLRDPSPGPECAAAAAGLARRLSAAIERLPARRRQVIVLHYLEGHTLAEVCQVLGVCPSRASQLNSEALAELRDDPEVRQLAA